MDEDLMQERIIFWGSLLHRPNFHFGELDQETPSVFHSSCSNPEISFSRCLKSLCWILARCCAYAWSLLINQDARCFRTPYFETVGVEFRSTLNLHSLSFRCLSLRLYPACKQVLELGGGVPPFQFTLGTIDFVVVACAVRLSIRSSRRLIEYKNEIFLHMRGESELHYNEAIPTYMSIVWASSTMDGQIFKITHAIIWVVGLLTLILGVFDEVLSPIVLPWQQHIGRS